ncbi:MAG: M1 family metallopeptidase [Pyrinomonadaceae bacterium]
MKINVVFKSIIALFCLAASGYAQNPTPTPPIVGEVTVRATRANIDPVYTEFRKLSEASNSFSGEYATVNNLVLKRDAATFNLRSGEIYFLTPAEGKTTGAFFFGDGEMSLTPPVESEKKMMNFFIGSPDFKEQFSQLVIFFTDQTFDDIKNSPNAKISSNGSQAGRARNAFRDKEDLLKDQFHYNMTERILMDAYAPPRAGFFTSFIEGKKNSKLVYQLDPLGIEEVSPEQVMLLNYSDTEGGVWTAFHLADEYKKGTAKSSTDRRIFDLTNHELDVTVRGTKLYASDKVTMVTRVPGQRVLPFSLYPSLRVKKVSSESGDEINIIQEDKNKDGSLAIILPSAPEVGKPLKLTFEYEGEGALLSAGTGNFILNPSARSTWYPNNGGTQFGDRATFDITFRYPKQFIMVGVGELVEPEKIEGDLKVAHWSTKGVEMAVAGFNYGDFVKKEYTDTQTGYNLEVYTNRELPENVKDYIQRVQQAQENSQQNGAIITSTLGALNTSGMANNMMAQTQNSVRIYNAYFGKLPHKRIAMTQQPAGNFGQAWATLIFMPYTAFFDQTNRMQLFGIENANDTFWKEVAPHEISHQWWGHAVGWSSYHDQWMSEGFAQLSASLYIQYVKKDLKEFNDFWDEQRQRIVESSPATKGLKPYTVGPVTQGFRLSTGKTGNTYFYLVYPKGAYILHMLRMMMYSPKNGDANFSKMMKDFVASHYNKDASTEDFKAIVEKHITPEMDIDKNGKMDWFFDEWVYGTDVPAYKLEYSVSKSGDKNVLNAKITQSNVSSNFVMPVPVYIDFGEGFVSLGTVTIVGNNSIDLNDIQLPKAPKKITIAALSDVLMTKLDVVKK